MTENILSDPDQQTVFFQCQPGFSANFSWLRERMVIEGFVIHLTESAELESEIFLLSNFEWILN